VAVCYSVEEYPNRLNRPLIDEVICYTAMSRMAMSSEDIGQALAIMTGCTPWVDGESWSI
jgi:hypothetical protein